MEKFQMETLVLGMVSTNCYLVKNTQTGAMLIFDPADDPDRIAQKITALEGKPEAILLTHGHFDHIGAASALRNRYGILIYAPRKEEEVLEDAGKNLTASFGRGYTLRADRYVEDGERLSLAGFSIEVIHTPGHTQGSSCYYFPEELVLFSGDTLFLDSVGRTDFPTGSMAELHRSLHEKLFLLPDETRVFPGHGGETSIGYEKQYNPY